MSCPRSSRRSPARFQCQESKRYKVLLLLLKKYLDPECADLLHWDWLFHCSEEPSNHCCSRTGLCDEGLQGERGSSRLQKHSEIFLPEMLTVPVVADGYPLTDPGVTEVIEVGLDKLWEEVLQVVCVWEEAEQDEEQLILRSEGATYTV